jgi:hypothetical protein
VLQAGISFDRTPAGPIRAQSGHYRVCAWHIDRDERPTCFMDVATLDEAAFVCAHLDACRGGWNVDRAAAFDAAGTVVAG